MILLVSFVRCSFTSCVTQSNSLLSNFFFP